MHRHIAVGALSGIQRSVHVLERMRPNQKYREDHKGNKQKGERAVDFSVLRTESFLSARREPQHVQCGAEDGRRDVRRNPEAAEERKRDWRPHGEKRSDHAAEPEPDSRPLFGKAIK